MKKLNLLSVCILAILLLPACLHADENALGLFDGVKYDIYISSAGEEGTTIIRAVDIVEVKEINGFAFLVIQTDDFASKRSEGLVMLRYVSAILPSHRLIKY